VAHLDGGHIREIREELKLRGVELSDANLYKTLGRMLESGQLGRKGAVYDLWLDEPGEA
jgi:hypothetical protein